MKQEQLGRGVLSNGWRRLPDFPLGGAGWGERRR